MKLSLSVGPDTFFDGEAYNLGHKDENAEVSLKLNTEGLSDFYVEMCSKYPIAGIMDPFESEDWESPRKLSERLGETIHVIGYHQIKSNNVLFEKAMRANSSDALCVKLNDIATVWETISLVKAAREASKPIHLRCASSSTEGTFVADLAVGLGVCQLVSGAPCRGEHLSKYNQLIRIEEELGDRQK